MNTQTHLLVSGALLARPLKPRENMAVVAGAVLPDLSIYVLFVWARLIVGIPERTLWREVYWQEPWQTLSAISNSFPLWALVLATGLILGQRWLWLLGASALIHCALDFPVHAGDAHKHFWPLSDWRYVSPLSYWDLRHNAAWVIPVEFAMGLVSAAVLWWRFAARMFRALLLFATTVYAAVPVYFAVMLG